MIKKATKKRNIFYLFLKKNIECRDISMESGTDDKTLKRISLNVPNIMGSLNVPNIMGSRATSSKIQVKPVNTYTVEPRFVITRRVDVVYFYIFN